ncbi:hypothetical protein VWZ88_01945 [Phaeobacter sp. JH20_36]|uniref:hypothetical protein n=1 Tax=unclassified Phaeobacter TaxID=2621772 RepID=UPI003A8A4B28
MKRTDIGGEVLKDDWVIIWDGREVGRIFFDDFPYNNANPWKWATWVITADSGRVKTMEEARKTVRRVVLRMSGCDQGHRADGRLRYAGSVRLYQALEPHPQKHRSPAH